MNYVTYLSFKFAPPHFWDPCDALADSVELADQINFHKQTFLMRDRVVAIY